MKKISAKEVNALADKGISLQGEFDELDKYLEGVREEIARRVEAINEKAHDIAGTIEDFHRQADEYYDERSEKWQEGEAGDAYGSWRDRLSELYNEASEDLELEVPQDPDRPDWLSVVVEGIPASPDGA